MAKVTIWLSRYTGIVAWRIIPYGKHLYLLQWKNGDRWEKDQTAKSFEEAAEFVATKNTANEKWNGGHHLPENFGPGKWDKVEMDDTSL
jgi:hypothetical protein